MADLADADVYQQARALIERYRQTYKKVYNTFPTVNIVRAKWDIADIIKEIGFEQTNQLFAYFFRTKGNHDLERFIYQYHDMLDFMLKQRADAERRKRLRQTKLD